MKFIEEHKDFFNSLFITGGGVSLTFTNIDMVLKVLVGIMTLVYISIKTYKELKK